MHDSSLACFHGAIITACKQSFNSTFRFKYLNILNYNTIQKEQSPTASCPIGHQLLSDKLFFFKLIFNEICLPAIEQSGKVARDSSAFSYSH